MQKFYRILLTLVFLTVSTSQFPAAASSRFSDPAGAAVPDSAADQPAVHVSSRLIDQNASGLVVRFSAPSYQASPVVQSGRSETRFSVPGAENRAIPGEPALPVYSALVAIPPTAAYRLVVRPLQSTILPGDVTVADAVPQTRVDPQTGDLLTYHNIPETTLAADLSPASGSAVRVAGEAWVRSQRVLRLEYTPIQYDAAAQQAVWTPDVEASLEFLPNPTAAAVQPEQAAGRLDAFEKVLQASLLNYDQALGWRAAPQANIPSDFGFTQAGDFSPAVQIVVDHDGIYQVTYAQLSAAGMDLSGDPANFQLSSQSRPVAYTLIGDGDAVFEPGESLIFYGQEFKGDYLETVYQPSMAQWSSLCPLSCKLAGQFEDYTTKNVYWLRPGTIPGLHMTTVDGYPQDTAPIPTSFPYVMHAEESHRWYSSHLRDEEIWFWAGTSTVTTNTFSANIYGISNDQPTVVITGTMIPAAVTGAHTATFYFNNYKSVIASQVWSGVARNTFRATVPVTTTVSGGINSLKARTNHQIYFDWFEVQYARKFEAVNNLLQFSYPITGTFQYQIKGLTGATALILDVTNPLAPVQILNARLSPDGGAGTSQADLQVTQTAPAAYIASGSAGLQTPLQVSLYNPPNLVPTGGGANYVFITHQKFITATNTLAAYRQSQGLSTFVVNVDDLYKQFNYGIYHSVAIRNYLAYAMSDWTIKPTYALLVGDGHYNLNSYTHSTLKFAKADTIYIPPNLAFIDPWQGQTDSTALLAMVVGSDPIPDLYIGRLLVNSAAQADLVVNKTINYEQGGHLQPWQKNLTYVADDPDAAGDFNASVNLLASTYAPQDFTSFKILRSNYPTLPGPSTQAAISRTVNVSGTLFMTYIGHASTNYWANEKIMETKVVTKTMINGTKLPVVLSLDCLDGFWHWPDTANSSSLAETMVRAPYGGAVAAFSPTGLGLASGHDTLAEGFYNSFFQQDTWGLAEAALSARLAVYASGWHYDLLYTYSIIGDPALQVQGYIEKRLFTPNMAR